MKTLSFVLAAALGASVAVPAVPHAAQLDPQILIVVESPRDIMSGIGLVNGFALSKKGAIDYVSWSVDGEAKGFIPYGGSRGDVAAAHPGYADSNDPGFATAWNYNLFNDGEHELVIRAYDDQGGYNEAKKKFTTVRFGAGDDRFLEPSELELPRVPISGLRLYPNETFADSFDLELVWSKGAQQWVIERVEKVCQICPKPAYGAPTLDSATQYPNDVVLTWSGGDPVVAYVIESRGVPSLVDAPWTYEGTIAGTERRFTVRLPQGGLNAIGHVEYRIRALGAANQAPPSNALVPTAAP